MNYVTKLIKNVQRETVETVKEDFSQHLAENKITYKAAGAALVVGMVLGAVIFKRPQIIQHIHLS